MPAPDPRDSNIVVVETKGCCTSFRFLIGLEYRWQIAGAMQDPFNSHCTINHAEEDHVARQRRHPQAGSQILAACVAQRRIADALALHYQFADKGFGLALVCELLGGALAAGFGIAGIEFVEQLIGRNGRTAVDTFLYGLPQVGVEPF